MQCCATKTRAPEVTERLFRQSQGEVRRISLLGTSVNKRKIAPRMNAKSWTGLVIWSKKDEPLLVRRVTAELRLDDEGGWLLSDVGLFGSKVDIRFGWAEVQKVEKLRALGVPVLGEALRFTLKKNTQAADRSEVFGAVFAFGGLMRKRTSAQILDLAESKGVKVERKARFALVMP